MYKRIYILIILSLATEYAVGQGGLQFGVVFDPTVMWFNSDNSNVVPQKTHLGFNFGMSVDYYFANNYAIASGISLFNTKSTIKYADGIARFRTSNSIVSLEAGRSIEYRIQYVNIPLGLKLKTHRIGRYVYSANMGFNTMIRASAKADFIAEDVRKYSKARVGKEVNFINMGWHFGGGASYSLGGAASVFGGISFMNTFLDMTASSRDKITSHNISFRIGVLF